MRLMSAWKKACTTFLLSLNAAVMRPPSGVHGSGERVSVTGSSNDCRPGMNVADKMF